MGQTPFIPLPAKLHSLTAYAATSVRDRPSPRRRLLSLALALGIEVLLLLAFLTLNFRPDRKPEFEGGMATFDLSAEEDVAEQTVQKKAEAQERPDKPVPPRPTIKAPEPEIVLPMLEVSKEVYAASDIAKLGTAAAPAESGARMAGGSAPGDSARVGTAPNGEPLYAAEWYREPTNAELSGYLPKNMPEQGGWGMVACRTAARFRVEDCVELGQGPAGSHLAGAVRQAAWQFLVRPPRVGGKPLTGEWVRIRIDYLRGGSPDPR
jgi:protein TonB